MPLDHDLEAFLYQKTGLEISNIKRYNSPSPISETIEVYSKTYGNTIFKFNLKDFSQEARFYELTNNRIEAVPNLLQNIDFTYYTLTIMEKISGSRPQLISDVKNPKKITLKCIEALINFYEQTDSLKCNFNYKPIISEKNVYFQNHLNDTNYILKDYFPQCLSHGDFSLDNIILARSTKLIDFQLISKGYIIEDLYQFYCFLLQDNVITSESEAKNYWEEVVKVFNINISFQTLLLLLEETKKKNVIKLFSHFLEIREKRIINKSNQHYYPTFFQYSAEELINIAYSMLEKREK